MTDIINWQELTVKDKTRLVLERVLGYYLFESEKARDDCSEKARHDRAFPPDYHHPVAYWGGHKDIPEYDDVNCWFVERSPYQTDADPFDPLHSLDDAWTIVAHITRIPQSAEEAERAANTRFMLWWEKANLWAMRREEACDAICVAALRAIGVEVQA